MGQLQEGAHERRSVFTGDGHGDQVLHLGILDLGEPLPLSRRTFQQ
jgi:hypothetical protein